MQEVDVAVTAQPLERHPVVRATLLDLPANTALRAQVAVRNTHYTGLTSITIDFFTPEGSQCWASLCVWRGRGSVCACV